MKLLLFILVANTLITLNVFSNSAVKKSCKEITSCLELSSQITDTKYIYDKDLKGSVNFSRNFVINKANVDETISQVLFLNGYTRISQGENTYMIINSRDIRYTALPMFELFTDEFPTNYDYAMVSYKMKNPYIVSEIVRNFRPFMSRYGRILDVKNPAMIIITDTGKNIQRLGKIIKTLDQPISDDDREDYEEKRRKSSELALERTKNCSHLEERFDKFESKVMSQFKQ